MTWHVQYQNPPRRGQVLSHAYPRLLVTGESVEKQGRGVIVTVTETGMSFVVAEVKVFDFE